MNEEQQLPSDGQSPVVEKELLAGVRDLKLNNFRSLLRDSLEQETTLASMGDYNIEVFLAPVETIRNITSFQCFFSEKNLQELEHRLCVLVCFLRLLESRMFDLIIQHPVDTHKLAILADEAAELKRVAREALAYFHKAVEAIETAVQPNGNSLPEPIDKRKDYSGCNSDNHSLNDGQPINVSEHTEV